jgi:steroid 5-alpha reductase family enzyme
MGIASAIVLTAVGLAVTMAVAWLIAMRSGRSGWVDAIWSFAVGIFGALVALAVTVEGDNRQRQLLVAILALAWSLRLGLHIAMRTIADARDDPRYGQLKQEWGANFSSRLFWFLQIQAAAAFLLVMSVMAAAHNPAPALGAGDWIGVLLMLVAIGGEALSDRQLQDFRADPANKGKVCDVGLWGLSRHPNYFFEWLAWLAYAAIAIGSPAAYPWGLVALGGPTLMYWLLVHVSGIPPLEAHMLRSRGDEFRTYQARVNAFWPGAPKATTVREGR